MLTGPKLQTELPSVILKWRQSKYVYTADITKMYRQIRIDPRDANYQKILWKTSPSGPVREFQLLTVTYGTASAPFLALRVLKQLMHDEGHEFPLAIPILQHNIYVDDVLFGADNIELLRQKRDQLTALLRRGGFDLRKWASNSSTLLSDIDPENHGLACDKILQSDENLKILGVSWIPASDVFQIQVACASEVPHSKRAVLSTIARLFDPLGWVTPVTITAKIFMQLLWKLKLDWDDDLPSEHLCKWQKIYTQLSALNGLSIARWIAHESDSALCEMHGFSDASSYAYSAVVYLKVISKSGRATISLIAGKSKVAPVKLMSVPRLELSAAVLLARLIKFLRQSIPIHASSCYCWTDSTIVLAWLSQHPSRWKTFVANRVMEIQTLLPNITWRHVRTADNPADCASRGLLGSELGNHSLWWKGPEWLPLSPAYWPTEISRHSKEPPLEARVAVHLTRPPERWDLAQRYSSWPKLLRVTAYIMKFIARCRKKGETRAASFSCDISLVAKDYSLARKFWLRKIQSELFSEEIDALASQRPIAPKSSLLSLNPFVGEDGLMRVGGRLTNAPIPFNVKHPIILASHPLVSLIIQQAHLRALHAGTQLTIITLRQNFWLVRARSLVRSIIYKCITCVRERAAQPHQLMGNLPSPRVSPSTRSFLHCGLDYAGPVQIRASGGRGITARKAYIALFICLATRAIHLELVGSYSTPAFLDAFRRFCSRRGLPESMHSDNGTTFVGADKELKSAYQAALRDPKFLQSTASDNIKWHFLPPSAPHFGGIWEAGVRSLKHHLRRVLKTHTLTFEEFTTLLCQIEACLNSRPLAPLHDTLDDYETLTPGHFLIGSALTGHPEPSLLDLNENRLSRWQRVRQITERIWKIWQSDYINTLQQRVKWQKRQVPVRPGQLVLLRNSNLPPCKWELGRIVQCHAGSDGLIRVVTVKTATSEYKRPIVKLCLLPTDMESRDDDHHKQN